MIRHSIPVLFRPIAFFRSFIRLCAKAKSHSTPSMVSPLVHIHSCMLIVIQAISPEMGMRFLAKICQSRVRSEVDVGAKVGRIP